eukprot:Phypoly_transcript_25906.p1 GENE.Phypoly_transcript_25906~~Phypoly_transcript_25906.p1  ORF type:complete len:131 (+),score=6.75 Phypoly_transcript_25906:26-394(+)
MGGGSGLHERIGFARPERGSCSFSDRVHDAVQKHHADILIVDEICNHDESLAIMESISRGTPVIASVSAKCPSLHSLIRSEDFGSLISICGILCFGFFKMMFCLFFVLFVFCFVLFCFVAKN